MCRRGNNFSKTDKGKSSQGEMESANIRKAIKDSSRIYFASENRVGVVLMIYNKLQIDI